MNAIFWLVFAVTSFSFVKSSLVSKASVFTGEILNKDEDETVLVRVVKRLFEQGAVRVPSTVSLESSEKHESLNATKGVYIFYAVPLDNNKFELIHYWSVKREDFDGISPSSLEGRLDFKKLHLGKKRVKKLRRTPSVRWSPYKFLECIIF